MRKSMIITGSRKGIGRHLAEYYLNKNYSVIGCSRSESDLIHENYHHYCLDIGNEDSVKKMIFSVAKKNGRIDCLINNAGIASMNHAFLMPLKMVEDLFRTNVLGTFLFCREAGKIMAKNKWGRIVNFSTIAVPLRLEGECIYAASKASVESMTRILAKDYASFNITVNTVGPCAVQTDLIRNIPEKIVNELIDRQGIKKFATFNDITNVIDFLIDENSRMVTGQVIYLGGVS